MPASLMRCCVFAESRTVIVSPSAIATTRPGKVGVPNASTDRLAGRFGWEEGRLHDVANTSASAPIVGIVRVAIRLIELFIARVWPGSYLTRASDSRCSALAVTHRTNNHL